MMHIFYLKEVSRSTKLYNSEDYHSRRYKVAAMRVSMDIRNISVKPGDIITADQLMYIVNNGHKVVVEPETPNTYFSEIVNPSKLYVAKGFKVKESQ